MLAAIGLAAAAPIAHAAGIRAARSANGCANGRTLAGVAAAGVIANDSASDAAQHRASGGAAFDIAALGAGGGGQSCREDKQRLTHIGLQFLLLVTQCARACAPKGG
jgi:hypothetical protein